MILSGSTVLATTTDCSRQLFASYVVVYKFLGVVIAPPLGKSP